MRAKRTLTGNSDPESRARDTSDVRVMVRVTVTSQTSLLRLRVTESSLDARTENGASVTSGIWEVRNPTKCLCHWASQSKTTVELQASEN